MCDKLLWCLQMNCGIYLVDILHTTSNQLMYLRTMLVVSNSNTWLTPAVCGGVCVGECVYVCVYVGGYMYMCMCICVCGGE